MLTCPAEGIILADVIMYVQDQVGSVFPWMDSAPAFQSMI